MGRPRSFIVRAASVALSCALDSYYSLLNPGKNQGLIVCAKEDLATFRSHKLQFT